jgi:hypothetical protein
VFADLNEPCSVIEVCLNPGQHLFADAELIVQSVEKNVTLNCIERGRQIKTNDDAEMLVVCRRVDAAQDLQ